MPSADTILQTVIIVVVGVGALVDSFEILGAKERVLFDNGRNRSEPGT